MKRMKTHKLISMVLAGLFAAATFGACCKDDAPVEPTLSVDKPEIPAAAAAGSYSITITSNTAWTVAVNAGATWCNASPASNRGNGTVNVTVGENLTIAERSATITITADTLNKTVKVIQAVYSLHAASTQTWTFGSSTLTWSDVIHIPECNKTTFGISNTEPACRSHTEGANTWYYYNWPYVNANAHTLCPAPWRVPAREDFDALVAVTTTGELSAVWGYGGLAHSTVYDVSSQADYWSSTEVDTGYAYYLLYRSCNTDLLVYSTTKELGHQVRCVK
jgi:hypothetical protein